MESASKIGMSPDIIIEARFMLQALFLGLILYLLYDAIRIARRVFPHGKLVMGIEDLIYWMTNTYLIFKLLFKYNYGIIRWFAILGVALGMLICKLTLRDWFVDFVSKGIKKVLRPLHKVIISMKKKYENRVKRVEKKADK